LVVFDQKGIISNQLTTGADNRGGRIIGYWYSAEDQPSNAVMAVLGIFGNERMKIIKVTI